MDATERTKAMQERIDELDDEIDAARRAADDVDEAAGTEVEERLFADSGEIHPEQDDQQITPPG